MTPSRSTSTPLPASPAGVLLSLFKAAGVCQPDGALVPDALAHLLHDPGGQLRTVVSTPAARDALLAALAGLVPELAVTGPAVHLALGPLTADADLAARTIGFTAIGTEGLLPSLTTRSDALLAAFFASRLIPAQAEEFG